MDPRNPSDEEAFQFAMLLQAGLPASEAITYFVETSDPAELGETLQKWLRSRAVKRSLLRLLKRPWHEMSLDEKIRHALDFHYASLAYFLFSHNYSEAGQADKAKADTARAALEAKVAGMAGKSDALSRFIEDLNAGRLSLRRPSGSAQDLSQES